MRGFTVVFRCNRGGTAIEYALVASLISIAAIAGLTTLSNSFDTMLTNVSNHM